MRSSLLLKLASLSVWSGYGLAAFSLPRRAVTPAKLPRRRTGVVAARRAARKRRAGA